MNIQQNLFSMQDESYKAFHAKLIPTVSLDKIIGVRTPYLRKFAREFSKTPEAEAFLQDLPHTYYEENNLHAFVIEQFKEFDRALEETERFLPYIDNWATCDMFLPKAFKKDPDRLLPSIQKWIKSDQTYTIRYAIGLLMSLYLDENFRPEYLKMAGDVQSEEYYVNMMIAWYFATALAKQYDSAIVYLTEHRLTKWVHNKTIQKAVESSRIPTEVKCYLKILKQ